MSHCIGGEKTTEETKSWNWEISWNTSLLKWASPTFIEEWMGITAGLPLTVWLQIRMGCWEHVPMFASLRRFSLVPWCTDSSSLPAPCITSPPSPNWRWTVEASQSANQQTSSFLLEFVGHWARQVVHRTAPSTALCRRLFQTVESQCFLPGSTACLSTCCLRQSRTAASSLSWMREGTLPSSLARPAALRSEPVLAEILAGGEQCGPERERERRHQPRPALKHKRQESTSSPSSAPTFQAVNETQTFVNPSASFPVLPPRHVPVKNFIMSNSAVLNCSCSAGERLSHLVRVTTTGLFFGRRAKHVSSNFICWSLISELEVGSSTKTNPSTPFVLNSSGNSSRFSFLSPMSLWQR